MTHRYLAIVIEFESDDELADAQRTGTVNEAARRLARELEPEGGGGIHVHDKPYRMQPDRHTPYTSPMTVDVHLPTGWVWSDGTGGATVSVPCTRSGCDHTVTIRADQHDRLAGVVRCGRHHA